jgi:glycerol kinase
MAFIMALDQGTTSSRAILYNHRGTPTAFAQKEFEQIFPRPGWVEHDAMEIWASQETVANDVIRRAGINWSDVAAVGITNQRETTVVWDRTTGAPIHNAIVWQDRRTADICDRLKADGLETMFRDRTGLRLDPYFSGTKIMWLLEHVDGARKLADSGRLAFGTIDSWLIWNLTSGEKHITDVSNASRTLLMDLRSGTWDVDLMAALQIPESILPQIVSSSGVVAESRTSAISSSVPIAGIAGDQQAALFGQACHRPGMMKNTYGTGCFMLKNTGSAVVASRNNLLSTAAWRIDDAIEFALEGSVFVGGAVVQWLRDGLGIIDTAADVQALAASVNDSNDTYLVPAFTGLGAPYWDPYARGTITGLTRGTTSAHLARAALESIAFQSADLMVAMDADSGFAGSVAELRVDGGASRNDLLMQMQADLSQVTIVRPTVAETTALGAAYLAGLGIGYWGSIDEIDGIWTVDRVFEPRITASEAAERLERWHNAVDRSRGWANHEIPGS